MTLFHLIGLAGAAIFIGSYLLLALGRITSGTPVYYALNLLGIGMALSTHLHTLNLASAIIQGFVCLISLVGLIRWRRNAGGGDGSAPQPKAARSGTDDGVLRTVRA